MSKKVQLKYHAGNFSNFSNFYLTLSSTGLKKLIPVLNADFKFIPNTLTPTVPVETNLGSPA